MAAEQSDNLRVIVDGKFFRIGEKKFHAKGVTYGPFPPNAKGEFFADEERTKADFKQIAGLGANVLRVYHMPPKWLLDLAQQHELKLVVDIAWWKTGCFLETADP